MGCCKIESHASGKEAYEGDSALKIVPDEFRNMVDYVIDSLFAGEEEEMCLMTGHVDRTLD